MRDPASRWVVAQAPSAASAIGLAGVRVVLDEAELLTIARAPARRGTGLGAALLTAATASAAAAGARRLFLEVADANAPARALYGAFGFEIVGRRPAYYRSGDGAAHTALILAKSLPNP